MGICRRWGCNRKLSNGVQCGECQFRYHSKCTGLSAAQYEAACRPDYEFKCMVCITNSQSAMLSDLELTLPASADNIETISPSNTTSPKPLQPEYAQTTSKIAASIETIKAAISSLADGMASLTSRIVELESSIRTSPLHQSATKALQLSQNAIESAAASQADLAKRAKNILIRGIPFSSQNPMETAERILSPLSRVHPHLKVTSASWFFRRDPVSLRPLLVTLSNAGQRSAVLQSRPLITSSFPGVTVHPDLPVSKRTIRKTALPHTLEIPLTAPNREISPESPRQESDHPQEAISTVCSTPSSVYASPITRSPSKTNLETTPNPCNDAAQRNSSSTRIAENPPLSPTVTAVQPPKETGFFSNTMKSQRPAPTTLTTIAPFRPGSGRPNRRKRNRKPTLKQSPSLLGPPNLMSLPNALPAAPRLYNPLLNAQIHPLTPYINQFQPLLDPMNLLPLLSLMRAAL